MNVSNPKIISTFRFELFLTIHGVPEKNVRLFSKDGNVFTNFIQLVHTADTFHLEYVRKKRRMKNPLLATACCWFEVKRCTRGRVKQSLQNSRTVFFWDTMYNLCFWGMPPPQKKLADVESGSNKKWDQHRVVVEVPIISYTKREL